MTPTRKEKDPTRQAGNRLKAKAEISRRVRSTRQSVLNLVNQIPVGDITVNRASYKYELDAIALNDIFDSISLLITQALGLDNRNSWFFDAYIGSAWQSGVAQSYTRLKSLTDIFMPDMSSALNLPAFLASPINTRAYQILSSRTFNNMEGFASQAAGSLSRILGEGVANGYSPRKISSLINKEYDKIEGFRSLRIARTEVNNAYNEARYESARDARDRLGVEVRVMHVSALVPATRPSHAKRHGHLYTLEEQREWWAEGSNKINCLCSTVEILFVDGEPTQKKLIKRQLERGKMFFGG